jgi:hypothetical protein
MFSLREAQIELDISRHDGKMTNQVSTFYYVNGKSTIKIKKPTSAISITGTV